VIKGAASHFEKGGSRGISNFVFLKTNWAFLFEDARESESNALTRPRTSAFYARRALELAIKWICANDGSVRKRIMRYGFAPC